MATYSAGEKTRELLVSAAGELAAMHGFSNVSTRAIAQRSGQNIGCIHYHFKSKLRLFEAVFRAATREMRESPCSKTLAPFEKDLDQPEVQSRAIRAIVKRAIEITFNPDKPWWHIRVLYQVIHNRDRMMNQVSDEVLVPDLTCLGRFFKHIKPELDDDAVFLHTMLINAPIIFHAHNIDSVLSFLKKKKYSKRYLKQMEDMIVGQTQMLLGLPMVTLESCSPCPRADH